MNVRQLATGLAVNRLLFGASFVAAPERSSRSWISITMAGASTAIAAAYLASAGARPAS